MKSKPLKQTITTLILGCSLLASCRKEDLNEESERPSQPVAIAVPCIEQKANPAGRSYATDSLQDYTCKEKHCGIMPLSTKNYWVYEDSVFNDGVFVRVQYDTLRYTNNIRSLSDGLTWWESELFVGLPKILYNSDSSFFGLQPKLHNPALQDVKRDYFLFPGDSVRYLAGFEDMAAAGRSLKMSGSLTVPAGNFTDYIYFEKNARTYRRDQVYLKPGLGVLKFIHEKAPFGQRVTKLQNIMTLVAFYME